MPRFPTHDARPYETQLLSFPCACVLRGLLTRREEDGMQPVMVTVSDLAEQVHMKPHTLYEFARREVDPMPLRTLKGYKRSSAMVVTEFVEWYERNSDLFKEVSHG